MIKLKFLFHCKEYTVQKHIDNIGFKRSLNLFYMSKKRTV